MYSTFLSLLHASLELSSREKQTHDDDGCAHQFFSLLPVMLLSNGFFLAGKKRLHVGGRVMRGGLCGIIVGRHFMGRVHVMCMKRRASSWD